jgi:signal transduction histidine kinase
MKKISWIFFALISIALFAVITFATFSPKYVGSSYFESQDFLGFYESKIKSIGPVLLNRLDIDEVTKNLQVDSIEIEQYRNYYGSQMDQIRNVQDQYQDLINEAENNNNTVLKEELGIERDEKIKQVRVNFADDDAVREKILTAKKVILRNYDEKVAKAVSQAKDDRKLLAYDLINVETNERFTYGDIDQESVFKETYGYSGSKGYLSVPNLHEDYISFENDELLFLSKYNISEIVGYEFAEYEGTITVPQSAISGIQLQEISRYERSKWIFTAVWIGGLLAAGGAFWLYRTRKEEVFTLPTPQLINRLKLEGRLVGILVTLTGIPYTYYTLLSYLESPEYFWNYLTDTGFLLLLLIAFTTCTIVQLIWLFNDSMDNGLNKLWENSMIQKLTLLMQDVFLNRSLGVQIVILSFVVFLSGLGLGGVVLQPVLILAYVPLFVFVSLPTLYLLFKHVADYNKLAIATEQMAKGQLIGDIHIRGKSVFAKHSQHLNKLREGVRMSQSEQAKSERLKTELITNVSHDLRTPLTSIITYTDLLKKPELTDEERLSYVAILDRKSQRLKTLIEDLFEVSKMASGNMELHKQRVDLKQLMQQSLAEHEEEIQKSGLEFRVTTPEIPIHAYVDGQKWWRVLDNLLLNAIKYTLPNTRVYVTLKEINGFAQFIVKNVTKYELGENVDELFERFKRADTSRHTDGSGLGLAIAQSIVDLHGGSMRIEVDGDLFKVTVSIKIN